MSNISKLELTDKSLLLNFTQSDDKYIFAEVGRLFDENDSEMLEQEYCEYFTKRLERLGFRVAEHDWWVDLSVYSPGYTWTLFLYIDGSVEAVRNRVETMLYNISVEKSKGANYGKSKTNTKGGETTRSETNND